MFLHVGLNEYDVEGQWLVQRQVLWKIPKYILDKMQGKPRTDSQRRRRREAWSLTSDDGEEMGEVQCRLSLTLIIHDDSRIIALYNGGLNFVRICADSSQTALEHHRAFIPYTLENQKKNSSETTGMQETWMIAPQLTNFCLPMSPFHFQPTPQPLTPIP